MEFFNRISPAYKNANRPQAYARSALASGPSGLLGSLLNQTTPAYKTVDGQIAKAPRVAPSFWSMFSASPSYKTAHAGSVEPFDTGAVLYADAGDTGVDESDACIVGPDQIVVL